MNIYRREVRKLDKNLLESDPTFPTAMVLLAATAVGTNSDEIAKATELPRSQVRSIAAKARVQGIFRGGQVQHSGWFEEDGGFAFWLDVCVAQGLMNRVHRAGLATLQVRDIAE